MVVRTLLRHALLSLLLALPAFPQGEREAARRIPFPELTRANLDAWSARIRPAGDELAAEAIDWIPDFARGLREASRQERPLLFWAMNGHPLGCT